MKCMAYDNGEHNKKIAGTLAYLESRIKREDRGKILISWKGSSIVWEDTTYGTSDVFVTSDKSLYNTNETKE